MAASMWEVTRSILGEPGDAAGIAQAHGFTPAEVADLLPLFADNVSVSWADAPPPPGAPEPLPGESPEEFAARWLGELEAHRDAGHLDVVSYDSFDSAAFGLDGADPALDLDDAPPAADAGDPGSGTPLDAAGPDFGAGPPGHTDTAHPDTDHPDIDHTDVDDTDDGPDGDEADDQLEAAGGDDSHDGADLAPDDPFELVADGEADLPDGHHDGVTDLGDAAGDGGAFA